MKVVVAVYDKKAMFYQGIYVCENEIDAIRQFEMTVQNSQSGLLHNYPDDFCLMRIGSFDERNGKFEQAEYNTNIKEASACFVTSSKKEE